MNETEFMGSVGVTGGTDGWLVHWYELRAVGSLNAWSLCATTIAHDGSVGLVEEVAYGASQAFVEARAVWTGEGYLLAYPTDARVYAQWLSADGERRGEALDLGTAGYHGVVHLDATNGSALVAFATGGRQKYRTAAVSVDPDIGRGDTVYLEDHQAVPSGVYWDGHTFQVSLVGSQDPDNWGWGMYSTSLDGAFSQPERLFAIEDRIHPPFLRRMEGSLSLLWREVPEVGGRAYRGDWATTEVVDLGMSGVTDMDVSRTPDDPALVYADDLGTHVAWSDGRSTDLPELMNAFELGIDEGPAGHLVCGNAADAVGPHIICVQVGS
jgi:hypothetical protein